MSIPIFVVDIYLNIIDAAGHNQYAYLVQADTKGSAMRTLLNYLDEIGFPDDHIDRYVILPLEFGGSNVVEMLQ